jgi:hypothetical protein
MNQENELEWFAHALRQARTRNTNRSTNLSPRMEGLCKAAHQSANAELTDGNSSWPMPIKALMKAI